MILVSPDWLGSDSIHSQVDFLSAMHSNHVIVAKGVGLVLSERWGAPHQLP